MITVIGCLKLNLGRNSINNKIAERNGQAKRIINGFWKNNGFIALMGGLGIDLYMGQK